MLHGRLCCCISAIHIENNRESSSYDVLYCIQGQERDRPLSSISKELVDAGQSLMEITKEREECLREFLNCQELVTWLRTSLEGEEIKSTPN